MTSGTSSMTSGTSSMTSGTEVLNLVEQGQMGTQGPSRSSGDQPFALGHALKRPGNRRAFHFTNNFASRSRSANPAATEQVHDRQQDDRADRRQQQAGDADVAAVDVAAQAQQSPPPSAQESPDVTHETVQESAPLTIRKR